MLHTRSKGNIGESVACESLRRRGYRIVERNYQKPWGEIDIVAEKDGVLHFVEVKSVSRTSVGAELRDAHTPEENVHAYKLHKLRRAVRSYLAERGRGPDAEFRFYVICVYLDFSARRARVKWLKDAVL